MAPAPARARSPASPPSGVNADQYDTSSRSADPVTGVAKATSARCASSSW
jgi:hypothetical protein